MISYDNCHCTRKKKKRKIGCDKSAYRNIFGCVSFWCIKEVSRSKFVKLNTLVVFILQAFFLTLYPQALGGKKISSVIWVFCAKEKNVCGIIHQHPATELSSASPGYVLDCYGSHANIIFLIFVPNTHISIIPMQPVYLQLLHQTYLE